MKKITLSFFAAVCLVFTSCDHLEDIFDDQEPVKPELKVIASGLSAPLGLAMDDHNRLWVTENGMGNSGGEVSLIMPNGTVQAVIVGFPTFVNPEGLPGGLNHLLYKEGKLYILSSGDGKLYVANVSKVKAGDAPLQASELSAQDIASFVLDHDFGEGDTGESNIYNLTFGPEGDLFIADAAANAIIRRDDFSGELSVFAFFPDLPNPTQVGPPTVDPVPTGIVWDGERFLVSTLIGFPFPPGQARIYAVNKHGEVSIFQDGFTSLVDLALGREDHPLVLQFSEAMAGTGEFQPMKGRLIRADGSEQRIIKDGLNFPTSLVLDGHKAYVTSLSDGTVSRIMW